MSLSTPLLAAAGPILLLIAVTGRDEARRPTYTVASSSAAPGALLAADAAAWRAAEPASWGSAPYRTSFRALHSEAGLWVRYDVTDPDPWHTLTERDDHLWTEEVVEIFVDPDGDGRFYAEVEINPANVVCDLLVHRGDPHLAAELEWDFPGLTTAVHALADDGDPPGWTAVALLPWEGFATLLETEVALPPRAGDRWRFNAFRIKRPHGPRQPRRDVILDAWSPVPGGSFHVPEAFGEMIFE